MLVIDAQTVEATSVANVPAAAEVVAELFRCKRAGTAVSAAEVPMYPDGPTGGGFYSLPAYITDYGVAGIKWTTHVRSADPGHGPYTKPLIVLNDIGSGEPLAVVDGHLISGLRTAAVSAQFFDLLRAGSPEVVTCCGTGFQARLQAIAALTSLPTLTRLVVWGRSAAHARSLAAELRGYAGTGVEVIAERDLDAAIGDADVVIGATSAEEPYLTPAHLARASYLHIGLNDVTPEAIQSYQTIVCDDFAAGAARSRQALFREHRRTGGVAGRVRLLEDAQLAGGLPSRVMCNAFGLAIFDVGLAYRVYRQVAGLDTTMGG